jgi:hypothetical protein
MTNEDLSHVAPTDMEPAPEPGDDVGRQWPRVVRPRAFLKVGAGVAAAAIPVGTLLATDAMATDSTLGKGDAAILRFLAAAEIIETNFWQQYIELGGVNGGNLAYMAALQTSTVICHSTSPTTPTTR